MRFGERRILVSNVMSQGERGKEKSPDVKISLISCARHFLGEVFLSYICNKTSLNQNYCV